MKKQNFSFKYLLRVFLFIFLTISGAIFIFSKQEIPGKIRLLIVESGSMEPSINTGSVVVIRPAPVYKTGDVITVNDDANKNVTITHRIHQNVTINGEEFFITKGDANKAPDNEARSTKNIIGKVFLVLPLAGYLFSFSKTPAGLTALIILPSAFIIVLEIVNIFKHVKPRKLNRRLKMVFLVLIITVGQLNIGYTISKFNDIELTGNTISAGMWQAESSVDSLDFYYMDDKNSVGFNLKSDTLPNYSELTYLITYSSDQGKQGIMGSKSLLGATEISEENLVLGSCSATACSYNTHVTNLKLEIKLKGNLPDKNFEKSIF